MPRDGGLHAVDLSDVQPQPDDHASRRRSRDGGPGSGAATMHARAHYPDNAITKCGNAVPERTGREYRAPTPRREPSPRGVQ